jgi:hypothetical protein
MNTMRKVLPHSKRRFYDNSIAAAPARKVDRRLRE